MIARSEAESEIPDDHDSIISPQALTSKIGGAEIMADDEPVADEPAAKAVDLNNNYDIVLEDGTLTVTPAPVTVTITGHEAEEKEDGTEKSVEGYDVEIDNELYSEDYFTFNGEAIAKGIAAGEYPMGLTEDMFVNNNENFDVTFVVVDGKLTILPEIIDVLKGTKTWVDEDDKDGIRPDSITVILLANDKEVDRITVTGEGNEWTFKFENLPSFDENGKKIEYTVDEVDVEGYTKACDGLNITNTHEVKPEEKDDDNPNTRDENNIPLWMALMMASLGGFIGILFYDKKRKKNEQ